MAGRGALALSCLLGVVLAPAVGADLVRAEGQAASVTRVSVDVHGGDPDGDSLEPSMSAGGRYIAFTSVAPDLVAGDANDTYDVFVRDTEAGTISRMSVDADGDDADGASSVGSISDDGRYIAFTSIASDLAPGDGNAERDVYLRDVVARVTTRVSVDAGGGDTNGGSYAPAISSTGRDIAFVSDASDLVPGDANQRFDVFVRDVVAGVTARVSVDGAGGDANGASFNPSISADGRYVAFWSKASDLVVDDRNGRPDAFVRDVATRRTTRVSVDTAGGDGDGHSYGAAISATGRYVAFSSDSSDLVEDDGNGFFDVFVRDMRTGRTTRVSVDAAGGDSNGTSRVAFIQSVSANGRFVAFDSQASDLVAGDDNGNLDAFVRDLLTGTTARVSVDTTGDDPDGASFLPRISATGLEVAFHSTAPDLVVGDGNGLSDVFIRTAS